MAFDSNVAALLAARYSRADSCGKGAGSGDILSALASNAQRAERTQGASRCHTYISTLAEDALKYTGDRHVLIG